MRICHRAVRQGDWKLVWGASEMRWELYNLKDDRSESRGLAVKQPERVASMASDWEAWWKRIEN
ncbi:MAG: hypothetical protein O7C75_07705 [Verrucomicrobia bacterium]|nr:hypothetical protein [Verrucomicrobiota bacterium]